MKQRTPNAYKCRNCNKIIIKNSTQQNVRSWCDVTNSSTILFRHYDGALKTSVSKDRKADKMAGIIYAPYVPTIVSDPTPILTSAVEAYNKQVNKNFYGTISSTGASG